MMDQFIELLILDGSMQWKWSVKLLKYIVRIVESTSFTYSLIPILLTHSLTFSLVFREKHNQSNDEYV